LINIIYLLHGHPRSTKDIDFESCYPRRKTVIVEGIEIPVISKSDLIMNKKSTGRLSDLGDAEKLD
jgi:hypothetical protein